MRFGKNRQTIFTVILLLAFILILWLPVLTVRQYNDPKEDPKYIRRVYAGHTVGQQFKNEHSLSAIKLALRGNTDYPATLIVHDEGGRERGRVEVELTSEDQWVEVPLSPPLSDSQPTLTFVSPPGTPQERAVLVRFQTQSDVYPDGHMLVDGQESYGDIGFRLYDRVPAWQSIFIWGQVSPAQVGERLGRLLAGVGIGLILFIVTWGAARAKQRKYWLGAALLALALAALIIRIPYLSSIEGIFGGDAFNYLSKANTLLAGEDPFAADPRKGPIFSLFLIPAFFLPDPLAWSRFVSVAAAVAAIVILPFIGRHFSLAWGGALGAGLLLAVNQDFIWESPNALANTLFVAFILTSVLLYLKAHTLRLQLWLAVVLALTFLTRYEGILVAAVLLPALWWREKFSWKRAAGLVLLTAAIMAIPQISFLWSGQPGIRTVEDLQGDEGLSLAASLENLIINLGELHEFARATWLAPEKGETTYHFLSALAAGLLLGAALTWLRLKTKISAGAYWVFPSVAVLLAIAVFAVFRSSESRTILIALPWFFIGVGVVPFLRSRPFDAVAIFILFAVQAAIITLILPKERYFLPLIPLFSLWFVFGLTRLIAWARGPGARLTTLAAIGIFASLLYVDGQPSLIKRQEKYNVQAHEVNIMNQAVKYLRGQHGPVGFRTGPEPVILTYLPADRRHLFERDDSQELTWLRERNIKYIVERNNGAPWQSVRAYPDLFEHIHTFENINGEDRVLVYLIDRAKLKQFVTP